MEISKFAKARHEKMFPDHQSTFVQTDPEFIERFDYFAFDEVINQAVKGEKIDDSTRMMAILATLLGCQGIDEFKVMIPVALNLGVSPVQIKEIVYQAVAYLGIGRVYPFLKITNESFAKQGISLPLEEQASTNINNRLEKGIQAQVDIFGEQMKDFYKSGPEETKHINRWLAANCFGDYYTRSGLDYNLREMLTFCFLFAQGGCEAQLVSHAKANIKLGNDQNFLINIVSQCIPYIGYPRSLNAINCIYQAIES